MNALTMILKTLSKASSFKSILIKNHTNELIHIFLNNPKQYKALQIYYNMIVDGYDEIFKSDNKIFIQTYGLENMFTAEISH